MRQILISLIILFLFAPAAAQGERQERQERQSFAEVTQGAQKLDGYFLLYWDAEGGKLLLEIPRFDSEFLYQVSLPTGVGSNPPGLDTGARGGTGGGALERAARPRSVLRALRDLGLQGGGARGRARARGRHRVLPARRARRGRTPACVEPGAGPARPGRPRPP